MSAKSRRRSSKPPQNNNRTLLPVLLLSAMAIGATGHFIYLYLSQPGRLPLRVVEINGELSHLQHAAIEERVATAIDGGFFAVDMLAVRDAVRAMPWVEEVSVRRVWPDTLRMHVTEQQPLARWGDDALVNLHGEVFRPRPMPRHSVLPLLRGRESNAPRVVDFYLHLYSALVGGELTVREVQLNERQEWQVEFGNGLSLMLGSGDVLARLGQFLQVYPQLRAQMPRVPERIDMRYEHGFAVSWQALPDGELQARAGNS